MYREIEYNYPSLLIITILILLMYNNVLGFDSWLSDGGDIREKEHLPVKQIRFGDTGTPLDDKEGQFKVGPLMCEGDGKFLSFQ